MATHIFPRPQGEGNVVDVRRQLDERLPGFMQPLITAITGRPRDGEQPLVELPTPVLVGLELLALGAAVAVGTLPFMGYSWTVPLLPYAMCAAVGRLRWMQTELGHYVVHDAPGESPHWATLGTVIPLAQNEQDYRAEHVEIHHPLRTFGTATDPDARVLAKFGLVPGVEEEELMRRLFRTLFSPRFHAWFLKNRMESNLVKPKKLYRRVLGGGVLGLLVGLLAVMPVGAWVVMILIPYTVGYQASSLLQFASEHYWGGGVPERTRRSVALSHGRFCGEAPPERGASKRLGWLTRMLTVHLMTRLAVLPGSLPSHDAHHVAEKETVKNWRRATYVRSDRIAAGTDRGMAARECWGLIPALRAVFHGMSQS